MSRENQPDLRLDPDARVAWSIPKQEWDEHVRVSSRLVVPSISIVGSLVVLVLVFVGLVGIQVWRLIQLPAGTSTVVCWLVPAAGLVLYAYFTRGVWAGAAAPFRRILAYRRRGPLVWERAGCVCPTCLLPFADDGRATCGHRVAACQQPTIIRLLEAEATEDTVRSEELEWALGFDAERLGLASRAPGRRLPGLRSRLDPRNPGAWPLPARIACHVMLALATFSLFWIAAGWKAVVWMPALLLFAFGSTFGRRSKQRVRSRPICVKCGHAIHDLGRTPVCTECASDLSKTGSVRSTEEKVDRTLSSVAWLLVGAAAAWAYLSDSYGVRALPTPALIGAMRLSTAPIQQFTSELDRRTLTADEQAAATEAYLRWSLRNPAATHSVRPPTFARSTASLAALPQELLATLAEARSETLRTIVRGGLSESVAEGDAVRIEGGTPSLIEVSVRDRTFMRLELHAISRTSGVEVVREDDAAVVPVEWRTDVTRGKGSPDASRALIPLDALARGTYELRITHVTHLLPLTALSAAATGARPMGDVLRGYPAATRTSTIRVIVE